MTLRRFAALCSASLALVVLAGSAFAQYDNGDAAGSAAACGGCAVMAFVLVIGLVVNIAILVWVAKDAKARGMEGALWMVVVFFLGLLGLVVYLFARPQGALMPCVHCGNNRLQASVRCPHCGNA